MLHRALSPATGAAAQLERDFDRCDATTAERCRQPMTELLVSTETTLSHRTYGGHRMPPEVPYKHEPYKPSKQSLVRRFRVARLRIHSSSNPFATQPSRYWSLRAAGMPRQSGLHGGGRTYQTR